MKANINFSSMGSVNIDKNISTFLSLFYYPLRSETQGNEDGRRRSLVIWLLGIFFNLVEGKLKKTLIKLDGGGDWHGI